MLAIENKEGMVPLVRQECVACTEHSHLVGHELRVAAHSFNPVY